MRAVKVRDAVNSAGQFLSCTEFQDDPDLTGPLIVNQVYKRLPEGQIRSSADICTSTTWVTRESLPTLSDYARELTSFMTTTGDTKIYNQLLGKECGGPKWSDQVQLHGICEYVPESTSDL